MHGRRRLRLAAPLVVTGLLVWLMVGCVYVPTWERVQLTGTRRDFRPAAGDPADVGVLYAVGRVTRARVEEILGPPPFATADGRAVAYSLDTRRGIWVVPLCLNVVAGREGQAAVRMEYRPDGVLARYEFGFADHDLQPVHFIVDGRRPNGEYLSEVAVRTVDHNDLRPTGAGRVMQLVDPDTVPQQLPVPLPTGPSPATGPTTNVD